MPEVTRDGISIHFEVIGRGAPVLLMHGGYVSGEYWKHAGYVDALSGDHQLILMDFRGHGRSSQPRDEALYGLRYDVGDALAVLDAAGVAGVTACGWSWGGTTGLALAALHPARIESVLAISSSGRHGRFSDLPADLPWGADAARRFETDGVGPIADQIASLGGADWLGEAVRKNDAAALAAWCRAQLNGTPIGAALADITQPVLFMPGELEVERLAFPERPLPSHAEIRAIPGANHVTAFLSVGAVTAGLRELTSPIGAVREG